MKIDCIATIGIVSTKQKPYWYKRKGYWVGKRYVKAKKIRKYKTVKLKEPYLSGDVRLKVYEALLMGGIYKADTGDTYVCTNLTNFTEPISELRHISTNLGKKFSVPQSLILAFKAVSER